MSVPLYDYQCNSCDSVFERLVPLDRCDETQECPQCHKESRHILSPVHFDYRMGLDPVGNPTMGDKWARMHEQAGKQARLKEEGQSCFSK